MLSEKMQEALNGQLNAELYSSYLYLSMSSYCESIGLKGFGNWMRCQAQEELVHAMKFDGYIIDRGGKALMRPIEGPPTEWGSPLAVFEHTYNHEQKVTGLINKLVDLAISESDHATNGFLQWFVTEQVEEEASADEVLQKLKLAAGSAQALLMIDQELATRVFTMPALQAQE